MSWEFSTDPAFQEQLDWMDTFVREEVEPLDLAFGHKTFHPIDDNLRVVIDPLKAQVRERGLWACHLGPELGGQGYGQVKLSLMNEILGRSNWGPQIFGTQAPDTGNAEIIAHYGTEEQKERYLVPLLTGEIFSSYSMTEPQGGSDPSLFETTATKDGDEWIINGWKYFSSNARTSSFLIVMALTDTETDVYHGMSMFLVPTDTPGIEFVRHVGLMGEHESEGMHALIHYNNVRVPPEGLLGGEGQAFAIAQTRLGGGRVHHAMRTVGMAQKALDMMCERAPAARPETARWPPSSPSKTWWPTPTSNSSSSASTCSMSPGPSIPRPSRSIRKDIAAIKVLTPKVLHDIVQRCIQIHGALGLEPKCPRWHVECGPPSWDWSTVRPRCIAPPWPAKCSRATNPSKDSGRAPTCRPAGPPPEKSTRRYLEHEVGNQ